MQYEVSGNIFQISETQVISDRFKKREFVVEVPNERNSDWNDFVLFQLTQDRVDLISNFSQGQKVKVSFNIRGKRYEKDGLVRFFTNLEAWRIVLDQEENYNQVPPPSSEDIPQANVTEKQAEDDLPF